ncbi:FHA domain-containing protein [Rhodococcus opacus]|uniref:FHA domain-containing protein n=1 Tax=Rhodococcus opacus TaxID=37919 RepID=UPI0007CD568C|nr:FHA domain-containing protein [Rhodococcus opacus]MDX5962213.1 FHA domain-containing protein [Rhodococcus opacus]NKY74778.1 FHA domain-containing protein [Rhodococcus opacus]CAG7642361.1 hypothetical protein E143388_08388 [Rhodococcus opacus]
MDDLSSGPRLCYSDRAGIPREFVLSDHAPRVMVGRSSDADIAFTADPDVSRLHATVERIGTYWTIVDDGMSRNGTFVNGERVTGRRRLRSGDRIRIGSSMLAFRHDGRASGALTNVAHAVPTRECLTKTQRTVLIALCSPRKHRSGFASPASNQQIADQLGVNAETVKTHMRALFSKFGVEDLPQNQKRARLVERAMQSGFITDKDL